MAVVTSEPVGVNMTTRREFPGGVCVRNITSSDCEFAGRVVIEGFRGKVEHAVGRRNFENVVRGAVEDHRLSERRFHRIFIAEFEGRPAGLMELKFPGEKANGAGVAYQRHLGCWPLCRLACFGMVLDESPSRGMCYLDHIAVAEGFRGKGIGKALLQAADEETTTNGCKSIYLWVADDNRAKNLYERQGYVVVGNTGGCCIKCITGRQGFLKMEKTLAL